MISDILSLVAAILALPSIGAIGFVLLTESWSQSSVRDHLPRFLFKVVNKMALEPSKWNKKEFYLRIGGFIGLICASIIQIAALIIKVWG